MRSAAKKLATANDLAALPHEVKAQLIEGEIVRTSPARAEHSHAIFALSAFFLNRLHRKGGGGNEQGGWWIMPEAPIQYDTYNLFCHDLAGWKRSRVETLPTGFPVLQTPDWVCEVLSKNRNRDLIFKKKVLHANKVPHYWLVDLEHKISRRVISIGVFYFLITF